MKRFAAIAVAFLLPACAGGPEPAAAPSPGTGPFSVIVMIGDGTGVNQWASARLVTPELAIDQFEIGGLMQTASANSRITDSAAGATAFATGTRTYNGAIGVDMDSAVLPNVVELAEDMDWSTGLVATSTITHATPAAFVAHVPSRNMQWEIARQMTESGVDVLLGGGRDYFDPAQRMDSLDLLGQLAERGPVVVDPDAFASLDLAGESALFGFFAPQQPGPAVDRRPSLPDLTRAALDVLEEDPDGFFLMVEGSQIDWLGHDNAPLEKMIPEVLDFDMAIKVALGFREKRPNTLVLVLADHETGGMALHADSAGLMAAHYTTDYHTAEPVPIFATGPGAAHFSGSIRNDEVGRLLLRLIGDEAPRMAGTSSIEP